MYYWFFRFAKKEKKRSTKGKKRENLFGNIVTYTFAAIVWHGGKILNSETLSSTTQRHDNLHKTWLKKERPYQIIYHSNFKQTTIRPKKGSFLCMYSLSLIIIIVERNKRNKNLNWIFFFLLFVRSYRRVCNPFRWRKVFAANPLRGIRQNCTCHRRSWLWARWAAFFFLTKRTRSLNYSRRYFTSEISIKLTFNFR